MSDKKLEDLAFREIFLKFYSENKFVYIPNKEYGFFVKSYNENSGQYTRNYYFENEEALNNHIRYSSNLLGVHTTVNDFFPFENRSSSKTLKKKRIILDIDGKRKIEEFGFTKKAYSEIIEIVKKMISVLNFFNYDYKMYFSGYKGFHIHILADEISSNFLFLLEELEKNKISPIFKGGLQELFIKNNSQNIGIMQILDKTVLVDVNKLIRLRNSLHPKSGILVKEISNIDFWWVTWSKEEDDSEKIWILRKNNFVIEKKLGEYLEIKKGALIKISTIYLQLLLTQGII